MEGTIFISLRSYLYWLLCSQESVIYGWTNDKEQQSLPDIVATTAALPINKVLPEDRKKTFQTLILLYPLLVWYIVTGLTEGVTTWHFLDLQKQSDS